MKKMMANTWAVAALLTGILSLPVITCAQVATILRLADPRSMADLEILRANGDQISGSTIRNSCGGIVRSKIGLPATGFAIVVEEDPTGACSGSTPPSSLAVLKQGPSGWSSSTSTIGLSYRLGSMRNCKPDIIVSYPPFQRDCPVLQWNGRDYVMAHPCPGGRGAG